MFKELRGHLDEFRRYLRNNQYEVSPNGIVFPKAGLVVGGKFTDFINGEAVGVNQNLMCDEGINHALDVLLIAGSQITSWYIGLASGAVTPAASWTAANIASNFTEITSLTQGYSEATRQAFTPVADTGDTSVTNNAAKATFTITASAPPLTVRGAFLISSNVRGGTAGTLISATRYASDRSLSAADSYEVRYDVDFNTP